MADVESVAVARKRVAAAYQKWLKPAKLSEIGSTKTRSQLGKIGDDGAWALGADRSKPRAWIVAFRSDGNGGWTVSLPPSRYPNRIGGAFNARSPLQGVLTRVIPVVITDDGDAQEHAYWEWALVFVFPSRPRSRIKGNSGSVVEFNHDTGRLWVATATEEVDEPYVQAALFDLVPAGDVWSDTVPMTYADATKALAGFLNVSPLSPPPKRADEAQNA